MNMKSLTIGMAIGLFVVMLAGVVYSSIAGAGTTVTVPSGKTMIYFTMNTDDAVELRDALCSNYNYQVNITAPNGTVTPNPQSCTDFGQSKIVQFARDNVMAYRRAQAEAAINTGTAPTITG